MDRSLCKKGLRVRLIGPKSLWGPCGAKISARQFDQMNPGDELVLDENGFVISLAGRNGDPDRFLVSVELLDADPELNARDRYNALSDNTRPKRPTTFAPGQRWRLVATARDARHSYLKPGDDALVEAVDANGDALLADGKGRFALRRIADGDIVLLTPTETLKNPTKKERRKTKMKLCKDCRFFQEPDRCAKQPDPVTGKPWGANGNWRGSAVLQRENTFLGPFVDNSCGLRGRFWQPKTTNGAQVP